MGKLRRFDFFINEEQVKLLKNLPGNVSEHIRRAIYEYLQKLSEANVSSSASKRGDKNGKK